MNYYVLDNKNIIPLGNTLEIAQATLEHMPQYQTLELRKTSKEIVYFEDKYYFEDDKEYIKKKEQAEKERIAKLSMTKLDFYKHVLSPNGIDYNKLQEILHTSEEMNACWQLCERVYRGDEVLCKAVEKYLPEVNLDELFKEYGS